MRSGKTRGCADIQVMPACERLIPALPVLTYPKVRSAPVLGIHHPRRGLTGFSTHAKSRSGDPCLRTQATFFPTEPARAWMLGAKIS
ncbi:MAG: hypothetical protein EOQ33_24040 [Mesorhizobium sp.]|nr:MAG: hypothetical protein EOQ33_24040 [Mesorhizobium sp.]